MPIPAELMMHGSGSVEVPSFIAVCPECGGRLHVHTNAWDSDTGEPFIDEIEIDCENDPMMCDESDPTEWHRSRQSDWQPVFDDVRKWIGVNQHE